MKTDRRLLIGLLSGVLAFGASAFAQTVTDSATYSIGLAIPDNDPSGISSVQSFSSGISFLTDLNVTLEISGNYNGDLYAYITHDSGFSVLLNRPGRSASEPFGYADGGFNVRLDDDALGGDIHTYRLSSDPGGGVLNGDFAPDGRNTDPAFTFDTDPRAAFLDTFNGLDPNGTWTLFVADVSPGGTSILDSWGIEAVTVIPEPATWAFMLLGGLVLSFGVARWRRR